MERLEKIKKKILNPRGIFITAIILSYAIVLFHDYTRIGLGRSNNLFLPTDGSGYGYLDIDTGMDFFNSIQYVKGKVPYTELGTVYPPLANIFFYFLYKFLPADVTELIPDSYNGALEARATASDLRVHQAPMVLFLLFVIISVFALYKTFSKVLKDVFNEKTTELLTIALCCSIGVVYSIERGNIILISLLLLFYYIRKYNSDNKVERELALIALALSAGLKLYPALFGILLIIDHKYKEAVRAVIYGLAALILPFFFFEGFEAIKIYLSILADFSASDGYALGSYGIQGIFKLFLYMYSYTRSIITHTEMADYGVYIGTVATVQSFSYIIGIILIVFSCFEKKTWRKYMYIVVAMLSVQLSTQYSNSYLIIPLIYFFIGEKKFTRENIVEYVCLLIMMLPVPLQLFKITFPYNAQYTMVKLTYQIGYIVLLILSFYRGICAVRGGVYEICTVKSK